MESPGHFKLHMWLPLYFFGQHCFRRCDDFFTFGVFWWNPLGYWEPLLGWPPVEHPYLYLILKCLSYSTFYYNYISFHFIFYESIVGSRCFVSFRCRAKWFSYPYIYGYICFLFWILVPYKLLQNNNSTVEYSSQCYTVGPCWLSILYIVMCIC